MVGSFFIFLHFKNFVWENKFYCTKIINKSQLTCRCNGKLPLMHRCTHSCSRSHLAMSGPECKFVLCRCSYLLKFIFKSINILLYESGITQNVFSNKKKKVHFNLKKITGIELFLTNIFWYLLEYPVTAPEVDPVATWGRPCPVKLPV